MEENEMKDVREKMQPYLDRLGDDMQGLNLNEALYIGMCILTTCLFQASNKADMLIDIHENLDTNYKRMMEKIEEGKI